MIVIAIIGILAAIAIPMYRAQSCKVKLTEVTNAMSHVASAVTSYYNENGALPSAMGTWEMIRDSLGVNVDPNVMNRMSQLVWSDTAGTAGNGAITATLVVPTATNSALAGCPWNNVRTLVLQISAGGDGVSPIKWDWDGTLSTIAATFLPKR
jgi:Tfp pilus assembly protein PilE